MKDEQFLALIDTLRDASDILVFSGAGISTASGIPDYRGPQGVWTRRTPVYYQDFMRSEAARIEYWDYKLEGWEAFHEAQPNPVHHAIVKLERASKLCKLITQNVDGLHACAGTTHGRLVELHGNSRAVECQRCHERSDPRPHFDSFKQTRKPPICRCGGYLKPATISFGQSLRERDLDDAFAATKECDLVIALGSTLSVDPAASVPLLAAERGVPYVIINRGATEHDTHPLMSLRIEGDVLDIFPPAVEEALKVG
ncbi:MAG: SIR2 family NAD-dependent protein deacylase [Gammaproteobacteria bacterium]